MRSINPRFTYLLTYFTYRRTTDKVRQHTQTDMQTDREAEIYNDN